MRFEDMKGALPRKQKPKTAQPPRRLTTVWGEKLDPAHVREEYPRPRLVRARYAMLNGIWQYAVTKSDMRPERFDGSILVPFSPESPLSGVERQLQPDEYLWYERKVPVPEPRSGARCLLHFGAVDQSAVVYVNGAEIMRHTGGYLPFTADLTDVLRNSGEHFVLTVRVRDLTETSYHSRGKQKLQAGGMYYTAQSGIWQSVWMELVPHQYLEDVRFETKEIRADSAVLQVRLRPNRTGAEGPRPQALLRIFAPKRGYEADRAEQYVCEEPVLALRTNSMHFAFRLSEPKLWTPDMPWIYPAEIRMGEDRVLTYFSVRTFGTARGRDDLPRVLLNGRPIFLNGVLNQGYWPDGLYTAPSDEAFVYDIVQMKALGFNMLRMHAKIEDARWYYHCDRLGMLVWQDMVNGGGDYSALLLTYLPTGLCVPGPRLKREGRTARVPLPAQRIEHRITARTDPGGRAEFRRECAQTVVLLRGYPCIMTWVLFNEGWGQFETEVLTEAVRRKDPAHLIDSASGWFEHKTGDFKSVHNYFRTLGVPRDIRANVLSEYGGYVYHVDAHSMFQTTYGYHTCTSAEEFEAAFLHLMTEEVFPLQKQGLCGAVYTQVSDIEEETNGLLTYDRRVRKISEIGCRRLREVFRTRAEESD